ncbi:thymidine phosphorylase family protein [Wenzhouxiangella sp. AB-CW3]|uniref:thymidine phosphorylase family protein n=1 Tax=Wenzhouxiangella sp. AB-CW3 TaxID=2771012 RepID=UPI00168B14B3|nr:thymidine phosphorylase family protein [Wenzhouxiangella sp. AB-CW3]QOC22610.1 thymidine phosphorylase family protein [Wenzhouxiangella sp. AB-CW3]
MSDQPTDPSAANVESSSNNLRARRVALDTHDQVVAITHRDCPVCRSEGFSAHARVRLQAGNRRVIATLYQIDSDLLADDEIALSESAWQRLQIAEGDSVHIAHPQPLDSLGLVRGRIYGNRLGRGEMHQIIADISAGRYADIHLAMFITAMGAIPPNDEELVHLTEAMVNAGDRLEWGRDIIADKHCVGGLPGNRTTPLVVAIAAACGLWMPKTSSRAITSPAGTADTMETLAPVDLDLDQMRRVIEAQGGCVAWGGAVRLSPVDDMLIRVARLMDIDAEGQMVASVLSKKVAAGATHLVIDIPVGPTAKVRSQSEAEQLSARMKSVADAFGLKLSVLLTDGSEPIGRGIGPALEAFDVLSVLHNEADQPMDLRRRAVHLAGALLELTGVAETGAGEALAESVLADGRAAERFAAICDAQGGHRTPPRAARTLDIQTESDGEVVSIDNRRLARVAKLAGAPGAPAAGLVLHVKLGQHVEPGMPLYTIHAETLGELNYAHEYAQTNGIIRIA